MKPSRVLMMPTVHQSPIFEKLRAFLPWSRTHHMIGFDLGARTISFVELDSHRGLDHVKRWGSTPLDSQIIEQGRIINRPALLEALNVFVDTHSLRGASVAMAVSGASVMVKRIPVPIEHHHDLDSYVMWEGVQAIPYDPEDVYLDYSMCSSMLSFEQHEGQDFLLIAAKRDAVDERRDVLEAVNLHPIICDVEALALLNVMARHPEVHNHRSYLVANILDGIMTIVVVAQGEPLLVRDISVATVSHEYVSGDRGPASWEKDLTDSEDKDSFLFEKGSWLELVSECRRTLEGAQELHPDLEVGQMFLCGSWGRNPEFVEELSQFLSMPVSHINPAASIGWGQGSGRPLAGYMGVAGGLALRVQHG